MKKNIIKNRKKIKLSKWLTLIEKKISLNKNKKLETYHSFKPNNYCSIFAMNDKKEIILVKQFRPAVEKYTLELPGGLVEKNFSPKKAIVRELYEETGYFEKKLTYLGHLFPDTGRHENLIHCYFSKNLEIKKMRLKRDKNIEVIKIPLKKFKNEILNSNFMHALHVAIIGLAIIKGLFKFK